MAKMRSESDMEYVRRFEQLLRDQDEYLAQLQREEARNQQKRHRYNLDVDKQLEEACRETCLDPRTPHSQCMPVLRGELLQRYLDSLDAFQRGSERVIVYVR